MEIGRSTSDDDFFLNSLPGEEGRKVWGRGFAVALAAIAIAGSGCAESKFWKDDSVGKVPQGIPSEPLSSISKSDPNQVILTSGTTAAGPTTNPLSWLPGKLDKSKMPATEIAVGWRHWIDYLPDPTRNGASGPGLAGQMFLFGSGYQSVDAEGTLTVDLYDETQYPPGQPGNTPERWVFDKDALKKLHSLDERFGKCYVLFLPWPTYRPDVTKVRIAVRYDANGKSLYPEQTKFTIGPSPDSTLTTMPNDSSFGSQGVQRIGAISLLGGGLQNGSGMGSFSPNGLSPNGMSSESMPLGVIGSMPDGVPAANRPISTFPSSASAMPISGAAMTNMPMSNMPASGTMPMTPGGFQAPPGMMLPPTPGNGGLMPVGGTPQGSPPAAFIANPLGR